MKHSSCKRQTVKQGLPAYSQTAKIWPQNHSETWRKTHARGRNPTTEGSKPIPCSWQRAFPPTQKWINKNVPVDVTATVKQLIQTAPPISLRHFSHRKTTLGHSTHDAHFLGLLSILGWCQCKLPGSPPATHSGNPPYHSQTEKATGEHVWAVPLMKCAQPLLVYDFNELQSTLLPHLINLCLWSLLEGIQYNVQVLFKFSSNSKGNITKHRENLWLHRPMNVFILEEISAPLHSAALF